MKNFKLILGGFCVLLMFASCDNEEDLFIDETNTDIISKTVNEEDFVKRGPILIFGRYYGRCLGESCVEIFLTDGNVLLEDTKDGYPSSNSFYRGKFVDFKGADRIKTRHLLANFPAYLLISRSDFSTYGAPNANDRGGVYLLYQDGFLRKQWLIDLQSENIPKEIRSYILDVNNTIEKIQEIDNLN